MIMAMSMLAFHSRQVRILAIIAGSQHPELTFAIGFGIGQLALESADKEDGSKFWYSQSARWTEDGKEVEQVYIDLYGTDTGVNGNSNNNYIYFFISEEPAEWAAGVEDMIVDDENAPVEYFNLQGVRVENPENGIFIRRQGSKTSKVAL